MKAVTLQSMSHHLRVCLPHKNLAFSFSKDSSWCKFSLKIFGTIVSSY